MGMNAVAIGDSASNAVNVVVAASRATRAAVIRNFMSLLGKPGSLSQL